MNLKPFIFLSIASVVIMIVLYSLTAGGYMGPNPVGQSSNYVIPLIIPAGYAFAIWSIIYAGIIAFPIYQLIKRKTGSMLCKQVHMWFSLNVIANGLWLVCASYDWLILSLAIIVFMLISLIRINQLLMELADSSAVSYWLEKFVFVIYFAWITLATVLNVSATLQFYKWDGFGISPVLWSFVILIVTAIIAGTVLLKYKEASYGAVVVWAFVALGVRHMDGVLSIAILSAVIAVIFILLIGLKDRIRLFES